MRRTYTLVVMLALSTLSGACAAGRVSSPAANASNSANASNAAGAGGNSAGSREGIGPRDTGIGGTSDGNTRSTVNGNSNVEPTGINKNAGQGAGANVNKP